MAGQQMIGGMPLAQPGLIPDATLAQMMYANQMRGAYGGGGSVGSMYHSALAGLGQDIARAMALYHGQHMQYNQQMGIADALSRIGVTPQGTLTSAFDAQGNAIKDVRPIIDKQALQQYQTNNHNQQIAASASLNVLNRMGMQVMGRAVQYAQQANAPQTPLQQATTARAKAQTQGIQLRNAALLGTLPPKPMQPPTGGQLLQSQQAQIKTLLGQQKTIDSKQTLAAAPFLVGNKGQGIQVGNKFLNDPSVLLNYDDNDPAHVRFGVQPGGPMGGQFQEKTNDADITHAQIPGGAADGSDLTMPISQYDALTKKAEQWQNLGNQSQAIGNQVAQLQNQQQQFNQAWGSISPQQQQNVINNLIRNPSPQIRGAFDAQWGPGAADTLLNAAQSAQKPAAQTAPTATPEETDTSGETEATAQQTPPPDTGEESQGSVDTGDTPQ